MSTPASLQHDPTGTWRVDRAGALAWEAVLRAQDANLIGAVSVPPANFGSEISDGTIDGSTITFRFRAGQRIVKMTGTIAGDEIEFVWDSQDRAGFGSPDPSDPMFGTGAPRRFVARRAPDATDRVADLAAKVRRPPAVTFERILHADREPQNWLTNTGTLAGTRYSGLAELTPDNVNALQLAWLWQKADSPIAFEATSLVEDGVLYTVNANDAVALDAATGRVLWTFPYAPKRFRSGYRTNRGLAILGGTLFMGTLDAHLIAIDAYSGKLVWNATVADAADPSCEDSQCYSITDAPLIVKNKVIVGTGGGEGKVRGFIAAFDAASGREVWRFSTIPGPGEQGHESWSGDSWKTGGAPVWNTGTYDPELNLTYWGTGNPAPNSNPDARLGDNLYSDSIVALDPDSGKLKWYYQFTPHDDMDWDSTQIPVLAEVPWQGRPRKMILFANRNGLLYALDRSTGEFLMGKPMVPVNWMSGFDEAGRPVRTARDPRTPIMPGMGETGATNWYPPSFSPRSGLLYVPCWEFPATPRFSALRAFDPATGERKWEFRREGVIFKGGALTTASGLLFTGVLGQYPAGAAINGQFYALDAATGRLLWQVLLPDSIWGPAMTYAVNGKQYVTIAAGNTLFAFARR